MVPLDSVLQKPAGSISLAKESSIYSLTLHQFQNHMGGSGKDVASMNMEEFISNIWAAEESHATAARATPLREGKLPKRPSLPKQGSLTLPPPLSRKTVDEVWSRARKQAYTVELENELTQMKEENTRLRKFQEEVMERRKKLVKHM